MSDRGEDGVTEHRDREGPGPTVDAAGRSTVNAALSGDDPPVEPPAPDRAGWFQRTGAPTASQPERPDGADRPSPVWQPPAAAESWPDAVRPYTARPLPPRADGQPQYGQAPQGAGQHQNGPTPPVSSTPPVAGPAQHSAPPPLAPSGTDPVRRDSALSGIGQPQHGQPQHGKPPSGGWQHQNGPVPPAPPTAPSQAAASDATQAHRDLPRVEPLPPPSEPEAPADLSADAQPTSALVVSPPTLSIEVPRPPAPTTDTAPATQARTAPDTGPGSTPTTGPRRTQTRTTARGRLGAGLVEVPVVPIKDPASAILSDPVVAESKRFCNNCGAKVGRATADAPAEARGECPSCGTPFNFRPRLQPGDELGGQYEVLGCLAYGGLGWVYLAKDHNVSDRWVVLKGMIDTGDATSMASAVAERRFLAEVEHPNVVKIYNFVQQPDPDTGTSVGYIVMEYVGGQSLRQLALEHHRRLGRAEPLPIGQVIAYGLEILPAIGYLHSMDMLYCDLKPDNVIQSGEQLKLIDLGAVRRVDDYESPLFFTLGYSAPELATDGASIASDVYTVGRTLAVLSIEFAGYTSTHRYTLPDPVQEPLFALFGSYHRLLRRATHENPALRFRSAEEMAEQLTGVLREVMALGTGRPRPGTSAVFAVENRTFGTTPLSDPDTAAGPLPPPDPVQVAMLLPLPLVDTDDPAAGMLASSTVTDPAGLREALAGAPPDSVEVRLRLVRAAIELGDLRRAHHELGAVRVLVRDPADWRPDWYQGLIALAAGRPEHARAAFDRVYDAVPGEVEPKLALAVCAELMGDYFAAARSYEQVWRTDHAYVSAAFGLARVYLAQGATLGAIEVMCSVPDSSSHHVAAQVAAIRVRATRRDAAQSADHLRDLHEAADRLQRLTLDAERRTRLTAEVLEAAYGRLRAGQPAGNQDASVELAGPPLLGCALSERELRFGLERCYRALARLAGTPEQRHELVDRANTIRPRTLT